MAGEHTHAHGAESHGGTRTGLGWTVLDSIVSAVAVAISCLLAEWLWQSWRARGVRFDLTPAGLAALERTDDQGPAPTGPETADQP